jgi:large subunit ribosomal protein L30
VLEGSQLKKYLMVSVMKIKIKQIRSGINRPMKQKKTLQALGLKKINHVVEHESTPQILGMVNVINHLVVIEK